MWVKRRALGETPKIHSRFYTINLADFTFQRIGDCRYFTRGQPEKYSANTPPPVILTNNQDRRYPLPVYILWGLKIDLRAFHDLFRLWLCWGKAAAAGEFNASAGWATYSERRRKTMKDSNQIPTLCMGKIQRRTWSRKGRILQRI